MGNRIFQSLLQNISSLQVEDLIFEEELKAQNYTFQYFIDPHDISLYCYPFGLIAGTSFDKRDEMPIDLIADEQVTYHHLFQKLDTKLLIFDEHFEEFLNFRNAIRHSKLLGVELIDSFQEMIGAFDRRRITIPAVETLENIDYSQVSLLLSIALGSFTEGIERLNAIRKNKLVQYPEELRLSGFSQGQIDRIVKAQPTELSNFLYSKLKASYSDNGVAFPSRLISRYRDCEVFDRLTTINSKLEEKVVYLFVSSAKISNKLYHLIRRNNYETIISEKSFSPVRSVNQLYLQLLCNDEENVMENLIKIKEIIVAKEFSGDVQLDSINPEVLEKIDFKVSQLRQKYENYALLYQTHIFRTEIEKAYHSKRLLSHTNVINLLKEMFIIGERRGTIEKTIRATLEEIKEQHNFRSYLLVSISSIFKGVDSFSATKGKDPISNRYHLFPIVFQSFSAEERNTYLIKKIIQLFISSEDKKINLTEEIIKFIKANDVLFFEKSNPTLKDTLIRYLFYLLLPKSTKANPENFVYEELREIIKDRVKPSDGILYLDFLYLFTWVARRTEEYGEALSSAETGLIVNPRDPRFHHSMCLINCCLYSKTGQDSYLQVALKECDNAIELYNENKSGSVDEIYMSITTLLNTKAYSLCLLADEGDGVNKDVDLTLIRRTIVLVKEREQMNYVNVPEFQHTEAYLELLEFLSNKSLTNKLAYAMRRIDCAIKIIPKTEYYAFKDRLKEYLRSRQ